jgi:hypothetical protein
MLQQQSVRYLTNYIAPFLILPDSTDFFVFILGQSDLLEIGFDAV